MRHKPHATHSHVEKTLAWIEHFRPEHAVLTNLHQELDYDALRRELPANVEPAFDQMSFDIRL